MKVASAALLTVIGLACLWAAGLAAVKVRTEFNKAFDFSKSRTWAWNDLGAGEVKMARTAEDDPEVVRKRAEPVIRQSVEAELPKRGLQLAAPGVAPDLEVKYYVLITVGTQSQQVGQFLPAVSLWGLPPFSGPTQSCPDHRARVFGVRHQRQQRGGVAWDWAGAAEARPDARSAPP
jgi:hypothetical protein